MTEEERDTVTPAAETAGRTTQPKQPAPLHHGATKQPVATVVLSAGAPNSPAMAGVLAAIYQRGKTFNTFYTSGAGGVVGLLFVASRANPFEALQNVVTNGIADPLYGLFPLPFKTFFKPGPFTMPMQALAKRFMVNAPPIARSGAGARLYNDMVQFAFAAMTPWPLSFTSQGLCRALPELDEVIDFEKLRRFDGRFLLNAFNIDRQQMEQFDQSDLDTLHFHAALAYPFLYSPVKLNGDYYYEGADVDPINFVPLEQLAQTTDLGTVVLIDLLVSMENSLIRVPRNLLDSYSISIMTPIVSLAKSKIAEFESHAEQHPFKFLRVPFDIPASRQPYVLDWSHSNMCYLWELGLATGHRFCDEYGHLLPDRLS